MPLKKLTFRPGINKETTDYTSEGGWYNCNRVRFREGVPETIGGWEPYSQTLTYQGKCKTLFAWRTLTNETLVAVGTTNKMYIERSGTLNDTTPIRSTGTFVDAIFTYSGNPIIQIVLTSHGAQVGDFVTLANATAVGGFTLAQLNKEHQVYGVVDANTFQILMPANGSSTTSGGGTVTYTFQINTSQTVNMFGGGWGAGPWGAGAWGAGTTVSSQIINALRVWSIDTFGDRLVFCYRGSPVYYWDTGMGYGVPAAKLTDIVTSAGSAPQTANWAVVSPVDRHLLLFGTNPETSSTFDPLLVRWCSREDMTDWYPKITNTAGSFRLDYGNFIVTARMNKQEILAWTDGSVYSIQYIGGQDVFGRQLIAHNTSIASPQAATFANGMTFWMGVDKFYVYNGRVESLPCSLQSYVFNDINYDQIDQVFAGTNEGFNEVWWWYPSANSTTTDKYVVFNYQYGIWYYGSLTRTAWLDSSLKRYPIGAEAGRLYYHENGVDDGSTSPPTLLDAYIETAPFDLDDGQYYMFVKRVVPDLNFDRSTSTFPRVLFSFRNSNAPGAEEEDGSTKILPVNRWATTPVAQYTPVGYVRFRGRQTVMRVSTSELGVGWRLGSVRLDMKPAGRK